MSTKTEIVVCRAFYCQDGARYLTGSVNRHKPVSGPCSVRLATTRKRCSTVPLRPAALENLHRIAPVKTA